MTGYSETFRGDVAPWEVDATEHFTVAYYYEKFESAAWRFLGEQGADPAAARTVAALTHYKAELRDRDIYRIETGLLTAGDAPTLAHRLFNAETGALCTTMQQRLAGVSLTGDTVDWDGDAWEDRPVPAEGGDHWVPSQRSVVRPEEADWTGALALPNIIHRFSTANSFVMAAFGLTPAYMTEQRRGLSTFEFQLTLGDRPAPGAHIDVDSCVAQLGGSSIRLYHRMRDAVTGAPVAGLSQFGVQLDLDARRPTRIADDLRERAAALVAPE